MAEKLRLAAEVLVHLENETVIVIIGVSSRTQSDSMQIWFTRTDKALYCAKQQGWNRVRVSEASDALLEEKQ